MERVHLAAGILERFGRVMLVESRYPNQEAPLWNLPGGRQRHGELLRETVVREFLEETSTPVLVGDLRYVSESYDRARGIHYLATIFSVSTDWVAMGVDPVAYEAIETRGIVNAYLPRTPPGDAHALAAAWIARDMLASKLTVRVVREPLLTNLEDPSRRYFAYDDAGIQIDFADDA